MPRKRSKVRVRGAGSRPAGPPPARELFDDARPRTRTLVDAAAMGYRKGSTDSEAVRSGMRDRKHRPDHPAEAAVRAGRRFGGEIGRSAGFLALGASMATPWGSPPLAMALGAAFALTVGNPFPSATSRWSHKLLQASVVGLGFGMPLGAVIAAGGAGIGYTVAGIALALALGLLIGRRLGVDEETALLITAGTSICGGSAIAAIGPAIGARSESMSVALATVFVLNGVALYLFPVIGAWVGLGPEQFAVWAAVAIHDTSSVVGAAAAYDPRALETATVLKLARSLWIVPLALGAAHWARRRSAAMGTVRLRPPWFIAFFVLAALARSLAPAAAEPVFDGLARAARIGLTLTLYLIGALLTRETLRAVGVRPLIQGVCLWAAMGAIMLVWVLA